MAVRFKSHNELKPKTVFSIDSPVSSIYFWLFCISNYHKQRWSRSWTRLANCWRSKLASKAARASAASCLCQKITKSIFLSRWSCVNTLWLKWMAARYFSAWGPWGRNRNQMQHIFSDKLRVGWPLVIDLRVFPSHGCSLHQWQMWFVTDAKEKLLMKVNPHGHCLSERPYKNDILFTSMARWVYNILQLPAFQICITCSVYLYASMCD